MECSEKECTEQTSHNQVVLCATCANRIIRAASDLEWEAYVEAMGVPSAPWETYRSWLLTTIKV